VENFDVIQSLIIIEKWKVERNQLLPCHFRKNFCLPVCAFDLQMAFDETDVEPEFRYNKKLYVVDGYVDHGHFGKEAKEATKILVFILRGLNSRCKQPVSYYFTGKTLDAEKIRSLVKFNISKCIRAGFKVVAISTDGDSKNRKLSTDLGCSVSDPSFSLDDQRIVHIYDVPHIIKLLRNHLMKHDFFFKIGQRNGNVSWEPTVQHLAPMINKNVIMSTWHKITKKHLDPKAYEKMRMNLATQRTRPILYGEIAPSAILIKLINEMKSGAMR